MRALIVGGSSGIGLATRGRLHADGIQTVDLSRRARPTAILRDDRPVDVTDRPAFTAALDQVGPVDHLIYCGGHVTPGPAVDLAVDDWDQHIAVNVTAAMQAACWRAEQATPGAIVLVSSTSGLRPSPGWAAYAAAKAALASLGQSLAVEWAPMGLRVYVVAPGRCATPLRAKLAPDEDPRSIMQPAEVAEVIATCVADTAGVLAGQVIEVKRR